MKDLSNRETATTNGGFINPFLTLVWAVERYLGVDLPHDNQGPDPDAN